MINYYLSNFDIVLKKNSYNYLERLLKNLPLSNFISVWRWIFFTYFCQTNISQQIECNSTYENPTVFYWTRHLRYLKMQNNASLLIFLFCKICLYFKIMLFMLPCNRFITKWLLLNHLFYFKWINNYLNFFLALVSDIITIDKYNHSSLGLWIIFRNVKESWDQRVWGSLD